MNHKPKSISRPTKKTTDGHENIKTDGMNRGRTYTSIGTHRLAETRSGI